MVEKNLSRNLITGLAMGFGTTPIIEQPKTYDEKVKEKQIEANSGVYTPYEARQYWKRLRIEWQKMKDALLSDVEKIRGEKKIAVRFMLEDAACGKATFVAIKEGGGYVFDHLAIEDDVIDKEGAGCLDRIIEAGMPEEAFDAAFKWIIDRIDGMPAPWVAWAVGPYEIMEGHGWGPNGKTLDRLSWRNVVYSISERRLVGIETHPNPAHRKYRVIEVNFHDRPRKN